MQFFISFFLVLSMMLLSCSEELSEVRNKDKSESDDKSIEPDQKKIKPKDGDEKLNDELPDEKEPHVKDPLVIEEVQAGPVLKYTFAGENDFSSFEGPDQNIVRTELSYNDLSMSRVTSKYTEIVKDNIKKVYISQTRNYLTLATPEEAALFAETNNLSQDFIESVFLVTSRKIESRLVPWPKDASSIDPDYILEKQFVFDSPIIFDRRPMKSGLDPYLEAAPNKKLTIKTNFRVREAEGDIRLSGSVDVTLQRTESHPQFPEFQLTKFSFNGKTIEFPVSDYQSNFLITDDSKPVAIKLGTENVMMYLCKQFLDDVLIQDSNCSSYWTE